MEDWLILTKNWLEQSFTTFYAQRTPKNSEMVSMNPLNI